MTVRAATLQSIASRLLECGDVVDVAVAMCKLGGELFGLHHVAVTMHAATGDPLFVADNLLGMSDGGRLFYVAAGWHDDPLLRAVCRDQTPMGDDSVGGPDRFVAVARAAGYRGEHVHTHVLPIFGCGELLGTIRCGHRAAYTHALRRDLAAYAHQASVRLAQLRVTTAAPAADKLTARQQSVARLASYGRTNREIADALELSENTVKKHLKDVFERLDVTNRTELAIALVGDVGIARLPVGVTRVDGVAITRPPLRASGAGGRAP